MADSGGRNADQDHVEDSDDDDSGQPLDEANVARRNPEGTGTTQPQALDVLLGRGRRNAFHPGNRRFQAIIEMNQARFSAELSKPGKTRIIQEIVTSIAERGRFLKYDEGRGGWMEVDDEVARTKVSHACRYRQRRRPAARSFPPPILSEAEVAAASQAVGHAMHQEEETERGFASNNEHSLPEHEQPAIAAAAALPHQNHSSQDEDSESSELRHRQSPLSYPHIPENASSSDD